MIVPGFSSAASAIRPFSKGFFLLLSAVVLTACTPAQPRTEAPPEPAPAEPVTEAPAPAEVICPEPEPEPEPVEPVVCPPPPAPKPCPACPLGKIDGKLLVGAVEYVKITPPGVAYEARIDSGADGSSIHASNVVRFERDGEKWVRFELNNPEGDPVSLERQVLRREKVMMAITLGDLSEQIEFSLNDRSGMAQPVLIGRDFLHNNAIVDVSQKFIAK